MSYTQNFSLSLGLGKAGLADLRAQLVDSSGANSGSAITTGFSEIGTGFYLWTYDSFADGFRGGVKFYSNAASSTILAFSAINPEEAENTDVKTSSRLASTDYTAPDNVSITAIKAQTDNLPPDPASTSDITNAISDAASDITVISAVSGSTVTVYQYDTWQFSISNSALALTDYEDIGFVVKSSEDRTDDQSTLLVRSVAGLLRVAGAEATASDGSLTVDSATQFSVYVAATATAVRGAKYTWWLKCYDSSPNPDEAFTLATGDFIVKKPGLRATS